MELSTVLSLVLVLLGYLWWKVTRPKSFPPGPLALPIVGNLLQVDFNNFLKDLKEFSKAYGPVYSIYLGTTPAVVVRGYKAIKEVLITKGTEFADRPLNGILQAVSGNRGLVIAPYGQAWKEHRRFTLSTLRSFGLGKKSMEERIAEESSYLIKEFEKNKDTLLNPHVAIDNAVSNIICSIVFGRRYDYDDSTFQNVLNLVHENMKLTTSVWTQEREQDSSRTTYDSKNLFACVVDLFVGGTDTTSASLEWCLLYMMRFPDIQEKCRNEIDKVRGDRERLDYEDRVCMPYTQAVLQEVQRFTNVVPLGAPHSTLKDEQLNGFTIPKGTMIIIDLSSLHKDETYWKYPDEFNPENFLNEDGELLKVESFLPFSAGPRGCIGENLARMELFLFFTTLLTHFEFQWPDPASPPDLTPVFGITQPTKPFKMRLVSRR
ncbi:cytochrome P450 2J6-like [Pelobates cultripes]|uniref:Cytochrome P450 2J6-like n=1 Tax=Pelobates cultripes TaxID=61616 RepID=A0AAD1TDA3_PELCU|nr:cytochrome P450 2J6-like [Pelobates cultripes]